MEKENLKNELKEVAPELEKLKSRAHSSFSVPDDYFSHLPDTIQGRIAASKKKEKPGLNLIALFPRLGYIAATAIIIIIAGYFLLLNQDSNGVNGFADEMIFLEYMEWYADYQGGDPVFYFENPGEEMVEENEEVDEELINYIADYAYYFLENPLEETQEGQ